MRTQVVSGFNPSGYEEYGRAFMGTFCKHWPEEVAVAVYCEREHEHPSFVDMRYLRDIPGCLEFIEKHKDNPKANGHEPVPGWRKKDERAGYAWRFDAVRFCRQLFIPAHAVSLLHDGDIFCWIDGDVITYKDVPDQFIENLLRDDDMIYLGRRNGATELGFWAIRVNPITRAFVNDLAGTCYVDPVSSGVERIFYFKEWHSGFVWDEVRKRCEEQGMKSRDMTPMGQGHVWFQCELGCYTDHLKGTDRKERGYSIERNQQISAKAHSYGRSTPSNVPNEKDLIDYVTGGNGPAGNPMTGLAVGIGGNKDFLDIVSLASRCKRLYVFEADPECLAEFTAQYPELADGERVKLYNNAVLDGGGKARRMSSGGYTPDTEGDVVSMCLDQLLPELKSCDIVRLNAGGAEQAVLHGMKRILADHKPLLIIRMCGLGKRYGTKDWQLQTLLEEHFNYEAILHAHPYYAYKYKGL